MFYKGTSIDSERLPGYICVPYDFQLRDLAEFVKQTENVAKAMKHSKKYLSAKLQLDKALDDLNTTPEVALPTGSITLANATKHLSMNVDSIPQITHAIIRLKKFAKANPSAWQFVQQVMVAGGHGHLIVGSNYRVYQDLTVELPAEFEEEDLSEFAQEMVKNVFGVDVAEEVRGVRKSM